MEVYVMHKEIVVCSSPNMIVIPRIGEKLSVNKTMFTVKDVVWHVREGKSPLITILV
jgi:hypothetical protein